LNGAANFDECPEISSMPELPIGPFWIKIGRKLHWMMPSANTPDSKQRQTTYRRDGVRFEFITEFISEFIWEFICGPREAAGGCDNVSRLASCEKTCQECN
jgi:hypothetical protein